MRIVSKGVLVAGVAVVLVATSRGMTARAATAGGITIAPAALTIELHKGDRQAVARFHVTNTYSAAVTLHFAFEQSRQNPLRTSDPRNQLSLDSSDITLEPNASQWQTATLTDRTAMSPGSQLVDLVISQQGAGGQGVGVLPSLRLPVTLIKDDGAVASLGAAKITGPRVAMGIPSSVTATLHNTGNMIAIPRGVVTVESPSGVVLAKGTLNEASAALSPAADSALTTKLTKLGNASLPGPYAIRVTYGLGGDAATQNATAHFFFIARWHIFVLIGLIGTGWYVVTHPERFRRKPPRKQAAPPKRQVLIGRDIT